MATAVRRSLWRAIALASCLAAGVRSATAAQGPDTEPAAPSDVERCELVIVPDLAGRRLSLRATLTIRNPELQQDFTFFLADWYAQVMVRSRSGPATFERGEGTITVHVPRPALEERLIFDLAGAPGRSRSESRDVIGDSSVFLLWSDRFYPVDFDDWAVVRGRITLPERFRLLAPGRLAAGASVSRLRTWTFETSQPIRAATIIADARWIEGERAVDGLVVRTLLHPGSQRWADSIAATSADVLRFYASRFAPYAFDGFTFATVEGLFARRSIAGGVLYAPAYLDDEMEVTGHDAHESALLWWFWTTAGRGPGSYQWTEGLGDYAEFLYDEARGRPIPPDFERYRRGYLNGAGSDAEPPITAPHGPLAGNYVHGRLPWLMHLLRFAIGDSAFAASTRLLFQRWRFRSFTLDELVATLAEGAGQPLDWWQREWLERRGVPELTWGSAVASDGARWRVTVTVEQTGELYHLPVEIGIETDVGTRYERVRVDQRSTEFTFSTSAEPRRVTLDPRRWLLAKITAR